MSVEQIRSDAQAMATAWKRRFNYNPTLHALIFLVAQGTHETSMGRAWPGPDGIPGTADDENNVGACTLRAVNAAEYAAIAAKAQAALASIGKPARGTLTFVRTNAMAWVDAQGEKLPLTAEELAAVTPWLPTVGAGHGQRASNAEAAIVGSGLPLASGVKGGIVIPASHIHCDSLPLKGGGTQPYFTWFAAFANLTDGCEYYLHLAVENKPAMAIVTNPAGTEQQFAAALRAQGYYTGFADNSTPEGYQKNVDAYANSLRALTPGIRAALTGWQPDFGAIPAAPPPIAPFDLKKLSDVQRALNTLGCGRPLLKIDGDFAKKSLAALGFYQGACLTGAGDDLIAVTGEVDDPTLAGLRRDLTALGLEVGG